MEIRKKQSPIARKPNNQLKFRWFPMALLLIMLSLALFLSACAGPRYGDYGGHGGHHYLLEDESGRTKQ